MTLAMTLEIVLAAAAALACGPLDRIRGHQYNILGHRAIDKLVYGYALAAAIGYGLDPIITPAIVLAMFLGMSPGWSQPMRALILDEPMDPKLIERWQTGKAMTDPWLALTLRGVIWGLPIIPVAGYSGDWLLLAFIPVFAIAMPLAMSFKDTPFPFESDPWGRCEVARGWIAGALLFVVFLLGR